MRARRDLAVLLSREALTQVRYGFNHGVDPWDERWPPSIRVIKGLGGGGTLVDRRRLIGAWTAGTPTERGFKVWPGENTEAPSVKFVKTHQYGATIRPKTKAALRFKPGGWRDKEWRTVKKVEIPARPILPLGPGGASLMPPRWERAFREKARELLRVYGVRE